MTSAGDGMPHIRLIATDLDGTIIGSANELPLFTGFRDQIDEVRRQHGAVWAVCTGRSLGAFRDYFTPMQMMGAIPDFVIVHHAYIYGRSRFGYIPHILWNLQIAYLIWSSHLHMARAIDRWHEMVGHFSSGVTTLRKGRDRLWLRFDSEASATAVADLLRERAKPFQHLQVFKYLLEVDVRSIPFTKGLAVSELAHHLNIPRADILTIGNGLNDISMLDGEMAGMTGCPANSEPEVMEVVHKAGGHIASQNSLAGAMEVVNAHATRTVNSALPDGWTNPRDTVNPRDRRSSRKQQPPRATVSLWILAGALYTVLLAFASFDLLPYSRLIMKPYWLLLGTVEKLVLLLGS